MQGINKINELLIREAERLDAMDLNDANYDREVDRAKALALTCCQYVQAETLILKRELAQQPTMKAISYEVQD
jgi:hypothetical protein